MALPELKDFYLPEQPGEVASLFEKYEDAALFVAGGTFIHGLEARGLLGGVQALVDLRRMGLDAIAADERGFRVGATVNFARLAALAEMDLPAFGALRDALACPPPQILNMATVGGSIAAACPFFDVPASLLALDAVVDVAGGGGPRALPLAEVYTGVFVNSLAVGEYIASVFFPRQGARVTSSYLKLETNANDLALVGVAVRVTLDGAQRISDARVVLGGGLNETHVRSSRAEAVLNGEKASDELFDRAAMAIATEVRPMADHRCSAEYRAAMGKVYVRRALQCAIERLH